MGTVCSSAIGGRARAVTSRIAGSESERRDNRKRVFVRPKRVPATAAAIRTATSESVTARSIWGAYWGPHSAKFTNAFARWIGSSPIHPFRQHGGSFPSLSETRRTIPVSIESRRNPARARTSTWGSANKENREEVKERIRTESRLQVDNTRSPANLTPLSGCSKAELRSGSSRLE